MAMTFACTVAQVGLMYVHGMGAHRSAVPPWLLALVLLDDDAGSAKNDKLGDPADMTLEAVSRLRTRERRKSQKHAAKQHALTRDAHSTDNPLFMDSLKVRIDPKLA